MVILFFFFLIWLLNYVMVLMRAERANCLKSKKKKGFPYLDPFSILKRLQTRSHNIKIIGFIQVSLVEFMLKHLSHNKLFYLLVWLIVEKLFKMQFKRIKCETVWIQVRNLLWFSKAGHTFTCLQQCLN